MADHDHLELPLVSWVKGGFDHPAWLYVESWAELPPCPHLHNDGGWHGVSNPASAGVLWGSRGAAGDGLFAGVPPLRNPRPPRLCPHLGECVAHLLIWPHGKAKLIAATFSGIQGIIFCWFHLKFKLKSVKFTVYKVYFWLLHTEFLKSFMDGGLKTFLCLFVASNPDGFLCFANSHLWAKSTPTPHNPPNLT